MSLTRVQIKSKLIADMTIRFPERNGNFPENLKIIALGFPSDESRREWGKKVNQSPWFKGWFTPSEFLACVTLGKDPEIKDKPNLIDLMVQTQNRPPEVTPLATELFDFGEAAKPRKPAAKSKAKPTANKKPDNF